MNEEDFARYLNETLDPAAAAAALSGPSLTELADALYRHLDTPNPAFGAHSWYAAVVEELQLRRLTGEGRPVEDSVRPEETATALTAFRDCGATGLHARRAAP